jgi:adenylate cyclase
MAEICTADDDLERKPATILFADVAAYSGSWRRTRRARYKPFAPTRWCSRTYVHLHYGRVFNSAGDAILAEFGSAVEAVRCATEIGCA